MKILCTQEFPGDLRMLGTVAENAPDGMEFVLMPPLQELATDPARFAALVASADAVLTCFLWAPTQMRRVFGGLPMVFLPHNACPVKAHYWSADVLAAADAILVTGASMREKTRLLDPTAHVIDVPYPRLDAYRARAVASGEPRFDVVFACTSYAHYQPLMGIPASAACWHELVNALADRGHEVAVLRHRDDVGLEERAGVHYFDQPDPEVLFAGRAVVSDIASNGLIAAALGRPVFQVVDRDGAVDPRLASQKGFLNQIFDIGPRYGRDWNADSLADFHPFGDGHRDLRARYDQRVAQHVHRDLPLEAFYERLREAVATGASQSI